MASIDPGVDKPDPAEADPMREEGGDITFEDGDIIFMDDFDENLEPGERALKWLEMEDGDGDENGDENIDSEGNHEGNNIDINDIDMKDAEGGEDINKQGAIDGETDSEKKDAAQKEKQVSQQQNKNQQQNIKEERERRDPFVKSFNSFFLPMALPSTSEDPMGQNVLSVAGHFLEASTVIQKNNTGIINFHKTTIKKEYYS
jgi:hypothetical protein